jgi:hypothetical protein
MRPGPCSGTPLAILTVEATSVEPLAYRYVPAPQLPPEIHSPGLSANPLRFRRIARGHGQAQFPLSVRASSAAQPPGRPRFSAVSREAL